LFGGKDDAGILFGVKEGLVGPLNVARRISSIALS
jgi:hypothetical protein